MLAASEAMGPAAQQLQQEKWKDAIPNEQKALQFLLRAEATFRQIEVAFGGSGGGGGGRRRGARSGQPLRSGAGYREESIRDPADRGDQRRTEGAGNRRRAEEARRTCQARGGLAQQQRNGAQTAEQKWQQEMLQREAQQLEQQMEQQLAQNGQQGQRQTGQQSQGQQGARQQSDKQWPSGAHGKRSPASGQSGTGADARQQAAQQALDRLRQANDDMRRAVSRNASAADSRRAADRLRQATDLLGGFEQQDAAGRLNSMAKTADQLAAQQKQQADHVRDLLAQQNAARTSGRQPTTLLPRKSTKWSTIGSIWPTTWGA